MNIYTGLLFQHGYIQNPELALSLAQDGDEAQATPKGLAAPRDGSQRQQGRGASRRSTSRLGALAVLLNELMLPR
mgnify:CR=1 FL=1|jgi:hypothetical protein